MSNELMRLKKEKYIEYIEKYGCFPDRYEITIDLKYVNKTPDGSTNVAVAGRIVSIRKMGKLAFVTIADISARFQLMIKNDIVGESNYNDFFKYVDIGDFLGASGDVFTTKTGEKTLRVKNYELLNKVLRALPEKFHGISDTDLCQRKRYLDLLSNDRTKERFLLRSKFISEIRRYLENRDYIEIETPVLCNKPSGALARPFISHHNALDIDVYLRIAPETYLKRAVVGGFTKVFEFARCFRNEGISPHHLQDFTMIECYCAYFNYRDTMSFVKDLLLNVISNVFGTTKLNVGGNEIDFNTDWSVVSFKDLLLNDIGINIDDYSTADALRKEIKRKNIIFDDAVDMEVLGRGNLIDLLYKKVSRPKIIQPTFLISHPISLSPLARANTAHPEITDRFQLIINGAEVINAYSELVDPIEQSNRLSEQAKINAGGDDEAMVMDNDYINAMEYGMPPMSGWGMGIDRVLQILTASDNIRDCVMFPITKPLNEAEREEIDL